MYSRNNKPNGWSWSLITIALLVSISSAQESAASPPIEEQDYYYDGEYLAEQQYTGTRAALSGLVSGAAAGPIGWVLGYAIAANMEVDVARRFTSGLSRRQRGDFNLGYRDYVMKKRRRRFNVAAAVGTAVFLVVQSNKDENK